MTADSISRTEAGQFAPGQSGNPAGRPKGARNRASLLLEVLREGEAELLVRRFVELALAGDRQALRFCAERLLPRPKGRSIELDLPQGAESDPAALITASIRAVADGEVTPAEALTVARLAAMRAKLAAAESVSGLYSAKSADAAATVPPAPERQSKGSPAVPRGPQATQEPARTPAVRGNVPEGEAAPVARAA
jgi:hypothetical protein